MAVIVASAVGAASLAGCSTGADSAPTGNAVRVPALWAGTGSTGGVAWVQVSASQSSGNGDYSVDLATQTAQGAGPQWNAAAGAAATTATLYSGTDPASTLIAFSVDGGIDGPSAGGILTVGVLAAIKGVALKTDVTMTGTISPDGGIGPIAGATTKVKAAAQAGFRTVLLPTANMTEPDSQTGTIVDVKALGAALNVTVKPIDTVAQAYTEFTGATIAPSSDAVLPPLGVNIEARARSSANSVAARLNRLLKRSSPRVSEKLISKNQSKLQQGRAQIAAGQMPVGYATLVDAYMQLSRDVQESQTRDLIKRKGIQVARQRLFRASDSLLGSGQRQLADYSSAAATAPVEAQLAIPVNLSDLVSAMAITQGARDQLSGLEALAQPLIDFGRVLAQERAYADLVVPNSQAILGASIVAEQSGPESAVSDFLGSYTKFMIKAGQANQQYFETVLSSISANPDKTYVVPGNLYPGVKLLAEQTADLGQSGKPLAEELPEAAAAISYFLLTTRLVARAQNFGVSGTGIGANPTGISNPQALKSTIDGGTSTVAMFANSLHGSGLNTQFPVWSVGWAASATGSASPRYTSPAVIGVTQIWSAALNCYLLSAARDRDNPPLISG